jgi:hypothetical protein
VEFIFIISPLTWRSIQPIARSPEGNDAFDVCGFSPQLHHENLGVPENISPVRPTLGGAALAGQLPLPIGNNID